MRTGRKALKKAGILIASFTLAIFGSLYAQETAEEYRHKGFEASENGNYDEAIYYYTKVLEINPASEIYNNRGVAYMNKGDNDSALLDFSKAIEVGPRNYYAYLNRAGFYYETKDYDKAWADMRLAHELGFGYDYELLVALRNAPGGSYHSDQEFLDALESTTPPYKSSMSPEEEAALDKELDALLGSSEQ